MHGRADVASGICTATADLSGPNATNQENDSSAVKASSTEIIQWVDADMTTAVTKKHLSLVFDKDLPFAMSSTQHCTFYCCVADQHENNRASV